jgi:hypothetical protein
VGSDVGDKHVQVNKEVFGPMSHMLNNPVDATIEFAKEQSRVLNPKQREEMMNALTGLTIGTSGSHIAFDSD